MGYICTRCGGTNVACEAIVNPNTGKIIDYFDGSFMHAICSNCENEVIISNIEEVKHEIDLRFHEFVERTGKEPEYVECQIVRKETGDEQRKTMKLSLNINDDDKIPTGSKVFYVECNISYCIGNMLFVTNMLECIKDAIEKYKKARTELSYRDVWGNFKNLMDYIEFFDMGTPRRLLKKSANEWLGTNHELSWKSDKIKREHVRELKRVFQILLNHQALEVLGTVIVIVDEVCGEGTWLKYRERVEKYRINIEAKQEKKRRAREEELDKFRKDFYEKLEKWKSGELNFLHSYYFIDCADVNAWMRIKGGIIETSKQIKIGIEEARRMWQMVSLLHRGGQFRHGLVEDVGGNKWSINRYENDILTAGCHRIAYSEIESIAKQLGWA